jgi:hypothetical protein
MIVCGFIMNQSCGCHSGDEDSWSDLNGNLEFIKSTNSYKAASDCQTINVKVKRTCYSGPLHTRAKSRDHEIVRAQKKVSKGRPAKSLPPKSCSVVTESQV